MIDNAGLKIITKEEVAKMKKLTPEVKKVTDEIPEGVLELNQEIIILRLLLDSIMVEAFNVLQERKQVKND